MNLAVAQTRKSQTFAVVALLVASVVSVLGWWTHLRGVMYGALLFS